MKPFHIPFLVAAALLLGGISIPSRAAEAEPAAAKPARPTVAIGMNADQVLEMIGKPKRVKKLKKEGVNAKVWIYIYRKAVGVRQVAATIRDIPLGEPVAFCCSRSVPAKMIPEMVYSMENVYITETTELLIVDNLLVSFKRYRTMDQDYN